MTVKFGKRWIQIDDTTYYRPEHEISVLKAWYDLQHVFKEPNEEAIAYKLEYFVKAFTLLRPRSKDEADHYLGRLSELYEKTFTAVKDIIDTIYENLYGQNTLDVVKLALRKFAEELRSTCHE